MEYWIAHSDSLVHQIFMLVMGCLYVCAFILQVSYKAINIFAYFVFFPLTFTLLLNNKLKFVFLPLSFLILLVPDFEGFSAIFFDQCVAFLQQSAAVLGTDYIRMSVYLCVFVPALLLLFLIFLKSGKKRGLQIMAAGMVAMGLYMVLVFPNMKFLLLLAVQYLS